MVNAVLKMCLLISMATAVVNGGELSKNDIPGGNLKTCTPVQATPLKWAPDYHNTMLKQEPKNMRVMFLGDSITMYWRDMPGIVAGGRVFWDRYYRDLPAGNYGISGDKTEHILWRITEGRNLDGTSPEVIVLLVGINNLYQNDSPEDTAAGISAITQILRTRQPKSKILLLGIFPAKPGANDPMREKIKTVNTIIKKLADNRNIFFLDIGHVFLEKDGSISKTIMRDYIHLSPQGYARWAEAMNPCLFALIKAKENPL